MTEKYAQALVAGSVPVVIGAPNIEDYAIAPNSMLVLQTKEVCHVHVPQAIDTVDTIRRRCQITKCKIAGNHAAHIKRNIVTSLAKARHSCALRSPLPNNGSAAGESASCANRLALDLCAQAMR